MAISLCHIALLYRATGKIDETKESLKESPQLYLQLNLKSEAEAVKQLFDIFISLNHIGL